MLCLNYWTSQTQMGETANAHQQPCVPLAISQFLIMQLIGLEKKLYKRRFLYINNFFSKNFKII